MTALWIVRFARSTSWMVAAGYGIYRATQLNSSVLRMQASAPQEASLIGFALVDLAITYILVRAFDVGFELQERRIKEKYATSSAPAR